MADRVAVLNQGRLEQLGTPVEIYDAPLSLFVNSFVGSCNLLPGRLVALAAGAATIVLDCGGILHGCQPGEGLSSGDRITACIRPDHLSIETGGDGLAGTVEIGLPLGPSVVHEVRLADGLTLKIAEQRATGGEPRPSGTAVRVVPRPGSVVVFPEAQAS